MTETWLTNNVLNKHIVIPNFSVYRHDKGREGGVCIRVRDTLSVNPVNVNIEQILEGVEDLWLAVQCRKLLSCVIGCMYHHPHSHTSSFDYIADVFNNIRLKRKPFYVLGDFNCNILSENNKMEEILKKHKCNKTN